MGYYGRTESKRSALRATRSGAANEELSPSGKATQPSSEAQMHKKTDGGKVSPTKQFSADQEVWWLDPHSGEYPQKRAVLKMRPPHADYDQWKVQFTCEPFMDKNLCDTFSTETEAYLEYYERNVRRLLHILGEIRDLANSADLLRTRIDRCENKLVGMK